MIVLIQNQSEAIPRNNKYNNNSNNTKSIMKKKKKKKFLPWEIPYVVVLGVYFLF